MDFTKPSDDSLVNGQVFKTLPQQFTFMKIMIKWITTIFFSNKPNEGKLFNLCFDEVFAVKVPVASDRFVKVLLLF